MSSEMLYSGKSRDNRKRCRESDGRRRMEKGAGPRWTRRQLGGRCRREERIWRMKKRRYINIVMNLMIYTVLLIMNIKKY
jgi:hypothetical protein